MTLDTGYLLYGRYRIESILGRGGMGAVYRATDENLGIAVALKENLFSTEEYARQFRREASLLAGLRHPNLPRVTDHFVIPGQGQYLVMDFIEGEDLRSRIDRGNLPNERMVVEWARQICDALQYLHSRQPPIIHRDIKPGNIRITPDGRAVLVDFGLARALEGAHTTTGAKAMTPGYSPPEQYGASRTDARTDIYALAATLYTLLTGAMSEDGLERALGQKNLTPIRTRNPKVSANTATAVERALEILPENRYQTIEEMREALFSATVQPVAATTGAAKPVTRVNPARPEKTISAPSPKETRAPNKGLRLGCILAGTVFVLVLVAAIAFSAGTGSNLFALFMPPLAPTAGTPAQAPTNERPSPTKTPLPPTPTQTPESAAVVETPTKNVAADFTPTSIGRAQMIAFVSDRSGLPQIYTMSVDGNHLTQITTMKEGACQPDWSPDGRRLIFVSPCKNLGEEFKNTTIFEIDPETTAINTLTRIPGGDFDPAYAPDGKRIAFASLQDYPKFPKGIYLMDANGENRIRMSATGAIESQPRWSADSRKIIFTRFLSENSRIICIRAVDDTDPKSCREISSGNYPIWHPDWSPDGISLLFLYAGSNGQIWLTTETNISALTARTDPYTRSTIARFSPDGMWILFDQRIDDNVDLYMLPVFGSNVPVRVTGDPGIDSDPAWRPFPPGK